MSARWSAAPAPAIDGEAGAGDLGAGRRGRACPAPRRPPSAACAPRRRRERVGRGLAPGAHDDAGLLAADGHARVGGIGDAQQELVECGLDLGQVGVEGIDPGPELGRARADGRDLRALRIGTALDGLADRLGDRVALCLQPVRLAEQRPPTAIELDGRSRRRPGPRPSRWRLRGGARRPRAGAAGRRSRPDLRRWHVRRRRRADLGGGRAQSLAPRSPARGWPAASRHAARWAGPGRRGRWPRRPAPRTRRDAGRCGR